MQSKATTVQQYLAELPADRRQAIEAVRKVVLQNIDKRIEEGMQYGMIGFYVPHSIYPAGYHCDPRQPLPYAGLASQKNYMSLYMMCTYSDSAEENWLRRAWAKSGKKLDMGKCCIRFKKLEDLPLDVIGESFRRVSLDEHIAIYEKALGTARPRKLAKPSAMKSAARFPAKKKATSRSKSSKVGRR